MMTSCTYGGIGTRLQIREIARENQGLGRCVHLRGRSGIFMFHVPMSIIHTHQSNTIIFTVVYTIQIIAIEYLYLVA